MPALLLLALLLLAVDGGVSNNLWHMAWGNRCPLNESALTQHELQRALAAHKLCNGWPRFGIVAQHLALGAMPFRIAGVRVSIPAHSMRAWSMCYF